MNTHLLYAMGAFATLAVLAGLTLDGNFRLVVWIFLGGLAFKTYIADLKQKQEEHEERERAEE